MLVSSSGIAHPWILGWAVVRGTADIHVNFLLFNGQVFVVVAVENICAIGGRIRSGTLHVIEIVNIVNRYRVSHPIENVTHRYYVDFRVGLDVIQEPAKDYVCTIANEMILG